MRTIIKRAFEPVGRLIEIDNTLKALQDAVGGYIEVLTVASDLAIICDEEGRIKHLPYNTKIAGHDLVGTILVVGVDGDEFCDIPEELTLEKWERYFL